VTGHCEYENGTSGVVKRDTSRLGEKLLVFHKIFASWDESFMGNLYCPGTVLPVGKCEGKRPC
jgi:hypothetical protein